MSKIVKMKYGNDEQTTIIATTETGEVYYIPVPCETYHQEWVNKALNEDDIKIEPYKTAEERSQEKAQEIRAKRDGLLTSTDWLVLRHIREKALSYPETTLSEEQYLELEQYRNTLTMLPEQPGFPDNITFPEVPDFVTSL